LHELLERFDCFSIVAECRDGNEALTQIISLKPQVAFLDIDMPGVSVFQSLPSLSTPPMVVFQTAYSEYAAQAYDIDALDYLVKPVRFERLEKTVAKIKEKTSPTIARMHTPSEPVHHVDQLSVTVNGRTKVISVEGIVRISFENGFSTIYTGDGNYTSDRYLNYYEEKLPEERFFRTSRTDIINLNQLSMIHRVCEGVYTIELENGMQIDLSRRKAQQLRKMIDF
jgi:two-component system, LytTR family, response regulator